MTFLQSPACPELQKFIAQYNYISINTSLLPSLKQTFFPYDIPAITLIISPVFVEHSKSLTDTVRTYRSQFVFVNFNALTTAPFSIYFKENTLIKILVIPFRPVGFSAIFRRDMAVLTDILSDFLLLESASDGSPLIERLLNAKDFFSQVSVLDDFFVKKLLNAYHSEEQITEACSRLISQGGLMSIRELASWSNMSLRTLERQFSKRVGVSPKMFARLKRFHLALSLIDKEKNTTLADVAYECGYYDPAHFTKEFFSFSDLTPSTCCSNECVLFNQLVLYRNFPERQK